MVNKIKLLLYFPDAIWLIHRICAHLKNWIKKIFMSNANERQNGNNRFLNKLPLPFAISKFDVFFSLPQGVTSIFHGDYSKWCCRFFQMMFTISLSFCNLNQIIFKSHKDSGNRMANIIVLMWHGYCRWVLWQ